MFPPAGAVVALEGGCTIPLIGRHNHPLLSATARAVLAAENGSTSVPPRVPITETETIALDRFR